MPKRALFSEQAQPPLGAYSQGIAAGGFTFVTGTGPVNSRGEVEGDDIRSQTRLVLENIGNILQAGGAGFEDVVKSNVYLTDMSLFADFNEVYAEYVPDPRPVRTTVGVDLSHVPRMLVQIDVIAYVGD